MDFTVTHCSVSVDDWLTELVISASNVFHDQLNEMVSTGDTDLVSTYDLPDSEPTGGEGGILE